MGKTQLINRIVNNSFCEYYEPTTDEQIYRLTYKTQQPQSQFVNLIIEDLFPLDHPAMKMEPTKEHPEAQLKWEKMRWITRNNFKVTSIEESFKNEQTSTEKNQKNAEDKEPPADSQSRMQSEDKSLSQYSAIIFVYDVNSKESFELIESTLKMILLYEEDKKKGKNVDPEKFPVKFVLGNKRDIIGA